MLLVTQSCRTASTAPMATTAPAATAAPASQPAKPIVMSEFIFQTAPFPSCHASTIAQTVHGGLIAAWFGGTRERAPDVGIWIARHDGRGWSPPVQVATGTDDTGKPVATWNPVLFQPKAGP